MWTKLVKCFLNKVHKGRPLFQYSENPIRILEKFIFSLKPQIKQGQVVQFVVAESMLKHF